MKIQPYVKKLSNSEAYKKFKEKHNDAFLVAGFFIIDLESKQNIHQIDFFIPSQKKIAAFTLDQEINLQILDAMSKEVPEELDIKTNIDLDAIEGILEDEMKNRNITSEIKKIIAVIQNVKGKKIWNLNCVLSGMEILKAHVEDESKTVLKMEKMNFMDVVKKIPGQGPPPQAGAGPAAGDADSAKDQIKKLDKLEEQIEKEKARLKKEAEGKDKDPEDKEDKDEKDDPEDKDSKDDKEDN